MGGEIEKEGQEQGLRDGEGREGLRGKERTATTPYH